MGIFDKLKEKTNEIGSSIKNGVTTVKEKTNDTLSTISGQKLLQQNTEYYEHVTQILLGIDAKLTALEKKHELVKIELNKIDRIERNLEELQKQVSGLNTEFEEIKGKLNSKNKNLPIVFAIITSIVITIIINLLWLIL